jgi:hypothetical protein
MAEHKSMKPGGGGRFEKMEHKLEHRKGVHDAGALAAYIGRRKYGAHRMAEFSAHGRARAAR